jgi:hypothetical protein
MRIAVNLSVLIIAVAGCAAPTTQLAPIAKEIERKREQGARLLPEMKSKP